MVGVSRKAFIGQVTGKPAGERIFGTAAAVTAAVMGGAAAVRVHDVAEMLDVVRMAEAAEIMIKMRGHHGLTKPDRCSAPTASAASPTATR